MINKYGTINYIKYKQMAYLKKCHLNVLSHYFCLLAFSFLDSYSWKPTAIFRTIIGQNLI